MERCCTHFFRTFSPHTPTPHIECSSPIPVMKYVSPFKGRPPFPRPETPFKFCTSRHRTKYASTNVTSTVSGVPGLPDRCHRRGSALKKQLFCERPNDEAMLSHKSESVTCYYYMYHTGLCFLLKRAEHNQPQSCPLSWLFWFWCGGSDGRPGHGVLLLKENLSPKRDESTDLNVD